MTYIKLNDKSMSKLYMFWMVLMAIMPLMAQRPSTLHLEGTTSYTTYAIDGAVSKTFEGSFVLATDSSKWQIKYIDDKDKTEQETTFDGESTYTLYVNFPLANPQANSDDPISNEIIVTNGQHFLNADVAGVDTYQQPVSLFASARVAWLGLPACGLIANPRCQLIPPWLRVASSDAFSYQTHYESISNRDCCTLIHFALSQDHLEELNKGFTENRIDLPEENFVEGRFRVISRTNMLEKCIPIETEFVRYWHPTKNANDVVRSKIHIKANKYYYSTEEIIPPELSRKTYVSDTRLKTPDKSGFLVQYALTNRAWVEKDDPRLMSWVEQSKTNYLRTQQAIMEQNQNSGKKRIILATAFVILAVSPIVWFLLRKRKKEISFG